MIGFYLPAFHESVRKIQRHNPKFYIFDTGIKKALEGSLEQIPVERTSVFGDLFESMVILEIFKLNSYFQKNYKLSYFSTEKSEIDLILTKNKKNILVEIKSSNNVDDKEVRALSKLSQSVKNVEAVYYLSRDTKKLKIENVTCMNWYDFLYAFNTRV